MYRGARGLVRSGPEQQQHQQGPESPLGLSSPRSNGGHSGELRRIRTQLPELFPWSPEGPLGLQRVLVPQGGLQPRHGAGMLGMLCRHRRENELPSPSHVLLPSLCSNSSIWPNVVFGEMIWPFPTQLWSSFLLPWKPRAHPSFWAQLTFGKLLTLAP